MHWPNQRGNRALALAEAAWAGSGKKRAAVSSRHQRNSCSKQLLDETANLITYFFTEISFAAMIVSFARVATESNHKIFALAN